MKHSTNLKNRAGFVLIEIAVFIPVIGFLIALLAPDVQVVRQATGR